MRKRIVGMFVVIALLAILSAQSVTAQNLTVHTWTDRIQYKPGQNGKLKISILNELGEPVEIYNITIEFPWFRYDAEKGEWVGNETIEGEPLALIESDGGDHYTEVEFTVPTDGRAVMGNTIEIDIVTSKGTRSGDTNLLINAPNWPMAIVAFDTWMTTLIAAVVVCTIILAIVVLFATRRTQAPRDLIPRATAPPPLKPKAKA
jgi:hypothetical protein